MNNYQKEQVKRTNSNKDIYFDFRTDIYGNPYKEEIYYEQLTKRRY